MRIVGWYNNVSIHNSVGNQSLQQSMEHALVEVLISSLHVTSDSAHLMLSSK